VLRDSLHLGCVAPEVMRTPRLRDVVHQFSNGDHWVHIAVDFLDWLLQRFVSDFLCIRCPRRSCFLNCPGFDGGSILWEDGPYVSTEAANAQARIGTSASA